MRRTLALLGALLITAAAQAAPQAKAPATEKSEQKTEKPEPKKPEYTTTRDFKNQVFEVKNRDPRQILYAVRLLGSGFQGAGIDMNEQLNTITVRDFPENIATIGEAIKRLDKVTEIPSVELRVSVLIGSKTPTGGTPVPADLAPTIKELENTLRFSNFSLLTSVLQRARVGTVIDHSGVVQQGTGAEQSKPVTYSFRVRQLAVVTSGEKPSVNMEDFNFQMRVPFEVSGATSYQQIGFNTPVSIRAGETVVLGTTMMGDKAVMVVVSANVK